MRHQPVKSEYHETAFDDNIKKKKLFMTLNLSHFAIARVPLVAWNWHWIMLRARSKWLSVRQATHTTHIQLNVDSAIIRPTFGSNCICDRKISRTIISSESPIIPFDSRLLHFFSLIPRFLPLRWHLMVFSVRILPANCTCQKSVGFAFSVPMHAQHTRFKQVCEWTSEWVSEWV